MYIRTLTTLFLLLSLASCERDFSAHPSDQSSLAWSADTISFDTIPVGYVTPTLRIALYNQSNEDYTIDNVSLTGAEASPFMVNVNGAETYADNVRLRASDSLIVFVALKANYINTGLATQRLTDCLSARSGNKHWTVQLRAILQNRHVVSGALTTPTEWSQDSIPYLIADSVVVEKGSSLTISNGAKVIFANSAKLISRGNLTVVGSKSRPIVFCQQRSDSYYADIPGQWDGIYLCRGAKATISNADIACPTHALSVDSAAELVADGLLIRDVSKSGISATDASLTLSNSIVINCGESAVSIHGGSLSLAHVTISNYYAWDYRHTPSVSVRHSADSDFNVSIVNSIVMGNLDDEVIVDSIVSGFSLISHSLLRTSKKDVVASDTVHFLNCQVATDARFANRQNRDLHLKQSSPAYHTADASLATLYPYDFEGSLRSLADSISMGALQLSK